jgi:UDP-glucose:glycoprotein glucosyltransferase
MQALHHSQSATSLQIFDFDHVKNPSNGKAASTLLIYADPLSSEYPALHRHLFQESPSDNLRIVLRWKPSTHNGISQKLVLSGYGVGLDLKRVDYITIDDRDLQHDTEENREQEAYKLDKGVQDGNSAFDDVFAEADDATTSELVQLKPEQLRGKW